MHTALFSETIETFFESQHKTCTFLTKATILSPTYISIPDRHFRIWVYWSITTAPQTSWFEHTSSELLQHLLNQRHMLRVCPTFHVSISKLQHALQRSLIFDNSVPHLYTSPSAFSEVSNRVIYLDLSCCYSVSDETGHKHSQTRKQVFRTLK